MTAQTTNASKCRPKRRPSKEQISDVAVSRIPEYTETSEATSLIDRGAGIVSGRVVAVAFPTSHLLLNTASHHPRQCSDGQNQDNRFMIAMDVQQAQREYVEC